MQFVARLYGLFAITICLLFTILYLFPNHEDPHLEYLGDSYEDPSYSLLNDSSNKDTVYKTQALEKYLQAL